MTGKVDQIKASAAHRFGKRGRRLLRRCQELGCDIKFTRKGHAQVRLPDGGGIVLLAPDSGEYRTFLTGRAELRRRGLPV